MSTKDITSEEVLVDDGLPTVQTDAAGYTPEMEDAIEGAVEEILSIPAVQKKVVVGWSSITGWAGAAGLGAAAVLGLAGVVSMPDWMVGGAAVLAVVCERLVGKSRTDQQKVLDAK